MWFPTQIRKFREIRRFRWYYKSICEVAINKQLKAIAVE